MSSNKGRAAEAAAAQAMIRVLTRLAGQSRDGGLGDKGHAPEIERAAVDLALARGWITLDASGECRTLTASGREFIRRTLSGQSPVTAAAATGRLADALQPAHPHRAPKINERESPLASLRGRRGRDGRPIIDEAAFAAGERLRADFSYAGLTPKVTSSWSAVASGGGRRGAPGAGVEIRDSVAAAQQRFRAALAAVGPELAGILIDVCCHLKGLEAIEREAGWPQRSAKIVLRLALERLARHYGLRQAGNRAAGGGRIRHWGAEGYRPAIDEPAIDRQGIVGGEAE